MDLVVFFSIIIILYKIFFQFVYVSQAFAPSLDVTLDALYEVWCGAESYRGLVYIIMLVGRVHSHACFVDSK